MPENMYSYVVYQSGMQASCDNEQVQGIIQDTVYEANECTETLDWHSALSCQVNQ